MLKHNLKNCANPQLCTNSSWCHGNRECKHLKVAVACSVSYAAFSTDQTIWLWHKLTFFVESCQNQSLQGNPNTSKQTSCTHSLEVRRQNKGSKQQTGAFFFFPHCLFSMFLESIYKVTLVWSLFLAGRNWHLFSCHCDCGVFREPWQTQHGLVWAPWSSNALLKPEAAHVDPGDAGPWYPPLLCKLMESALSL